MPPHEMWMSVQEVWESPGFLPLEYLSHWVDASGIPQLPYENVDVYSDLLNLDNDGQMPVALLSLDGKLAASRIRILLSADITQRFENRLVKSQVQIDDMYMKMFNV